MLFGLALRLVLPRPAVWAWFLIVLLCISLPSSSPCSGGIFLGLAPGMFAAPCRRGFSIFANLAVLHAALHPCRIFIFFRTTTQLAFCLRRFLLVCFFVRFTRRIQRLPVDVAIVLALTSSVLSLRQIPPSLPSLPQLVAFATPARRLHFPPVAPTPPPPPASVAFISHSRRLHFPPSRRLHFPPSRHLHFLPSRRLHFPFPSPSLSLPVAFTSPSRRLRLPFPSPSLPLPIAFSSLSHRLQFPLPSASIPSSVAFTSPPPMRSIPPPVAFPACRTRFPALHTRFPTRCLHFPFHCLSLSPAHSLSPCSLSFPLLTLFPPAHSFSHPLLSPLLFTPCSHPSSPLHSTVPPCSLSFPLLTLFPPALSL
ncbi:unnamed protein product [Closterium sp. NIES-65]|nr:unnamed protein product [Closterium sp. NIES-65]